MLDADSEVCQRDIITAPVPGFGTDAPCSAASETSRTEIKRGGVRPGAGRPAITTERPWQTEGISRSTYYERLKPVAPVQISYAVDTARWAVIAYFGQAELSGAGELTRQGYETYTPLVAVRRRDPVVATIYHTVRVTLFSGYGFIRITATESRDPIMNTRGVRDVLRRPDGRPAWVRDGEIEQMRSMDSKRLELPREHAPSLAVGASVRIEDGAFTSFSGRVLECDGVKTRVAVLMFGREVPVWLDRVAVTKVV